MLLLCLCCSPGWIAAQEAETVRLQLKWFHQFQFAGYYAALEKGFYADEGLDVVLLERDPGKNHVQSVLDGTAEYGTADAGLYVNRADGDPVVLLAQIHQHSPHVFISLASSGIVSPFEMVGKRIMLDAESRDEASLLAAIIATHGRMPEITFVPQSFRLDELVNGEVDVLDGYVTNEPFILRERGLEVNVIDPQSYGIDFYGDNLFTTEAEIQGHPGRAEKLTRATLRGWEYALEHPDEIIELIRTRYNTQNLSLPRLQYEARLTANLIAADFVTLGQILPARYRLIGEIFAKLGYTDRAEVIEGFILNARPEPKIALTPDELEWIRTHPWVTVGNEMDWAPFDFSENGKASGYSIDLLRAVGEKLGLRFKFINGFPWSELVEMFKRGELEVLPAIAETPERSEYMAFTRSYLSNPSAIFVREGDASIKQLKDLEGRRLAVVKDALQEETIRHESPSIQVVPFNDVLSCLTAVLDGRADAYVDSREVTLHAIEKHFLRGIAVAAESGIGNPRDYQIRMAVQKDNEILARILEKGMDALSGEEQRAIARPWLASVTQAEAREETVVPLTPKEIQWIMEHPVIRFTGDPDWMPQESFTPDGAYVGIVADMLDLLESRLGVQFERVPASSWSEAVRMATTHEVDVLSESISAERPGLAFSHAYIRFPVVVFARQGARAIASPGELHGRSVGVVADYGYVPPLRRDYPDLNYVEVGTVREGMLKVASGELDAFVEAFPTASHIKSELGLTGVAAIGATEYSINLGFAVRDDWPELLSIINKGIASVTETERLTIQRKWVVEEGRRIDTAPVPVTDRALLLLFSVAALAVAFALLILWAVQGFPRHFTIRQMLLLVTLAYSGLVILIGALISMLLEGMTSQSEAEQNRHDSFSLAAEVTQSCEDLTKMARMFAQTGDERYAEYFNAILRIRAGELPHPQESSSFYWQYVMAGIGSLDAGGRTYSIEQRMDELDIPEDEQRRIHNALQKSNALASIENAAMNAVRGLFKDDQGNFTRKGTPDFEMARELLYGAEYLHIKATIMGDIDEFSRVLDARVSNALAKVRARNMAVLWLTAGLTALAIVLSVYLFFLLKRRIVAPLSLLEAGTSALKEGDYARRIAIPTRDEMGHLAEVFNSMAESIAERTEELRQREEKFRAIFDQTVQLMAVLDTEGRLQEANRAAIELAGAKDEALLNRPLWAGIWWQHHPDLEQQLHEAVQRAGAGEPVRTEVENRDVHGRMRCIDFALVPVRDAAGRTIFLLAMGHDITELREAEQTARRYEFIVNSNFDMMTLLNVDGVYEAVNDAWCKAMQRDREETVGRPFTQVWGQDVYDRDIRPCFERCRKGEIVPTAAWMDLPASGKRFCAVSYYPYLGDEGSVTHIAVVTRDISERKKAEDELRRSEEHSKRYMFMADSVHDMMSFIRADGVYEAVNAAWLGAMNLRPETVLGRTVEDVWGKAAALDNIRPRLELCIAGDSQTYYGWMTLPSRGQCYCETTLTPYRDVENRITHAVVVTRDITMRQQAEEQLKRINFLSDIALDLSRSAYWVVDYADPEYYHLSERGARILGEPVRPDGRYLLDSEWFARLVEADPEIAAATSEQYAAAVNGICENYDAIYPYKRPEDSAIVWLHASGRCVRDEKGAIQFMYGVYQDITEQRAIEEELRAAKAAADEATRAKSDFLATMSHEIRTPMNAVIGLTHLALKTELTQQQTDYLVKIKSSANALLGIINDVLDFSKIEAGRLDVEVVEFDLDEVLDNLSNVVSTRALEKPDIEVHFDVPPEIPRRLKGDPLRLGQILVNLSTNAVKFTEEGDVVISARVVEETEDAVQVRFDVRDSGIGMSPEQLAKLFTPFTQADSSTTRKYGGTGLGLTISQRLCETMGGRIEAQSVAGEGSHFFFTLPFGKGGNEPRGGDVTGKTKNLHVLVVEDNATSRHILESILLSFDYRVSCVASAEEGFAEIDNAKEEDPFDLILMDWKLPGMNGVEAAQVIKSNPRLTSVPFIFLVTAYGREIVSRESDTLGIDTVLLKPITPSSLFDAIVSIFNAGASRHRRSDLHDDAEAEVRRQIAGTRILLVEDNEINQQIARELLTGVGAMVDTANNGEEAVAMVALQTYDIVLMDCQMPVMDGYTATRIIRNKQGMADLPIVAMTANAMAGDREACLAAGMNDHVAKPIDPRDLYAALLSWARPAPEGVAASRAASTPSEPAGMARIVLPPIPGVDVETGVKRVGGNKTLYASLLRKLLRDYQDSPAKLEQLVRDYQFEEAERLAHSIKGVAGNLGASELQDAAKDLEAALKTRQGGPPNEMTRFAAELTRVTGAIQASALPEEAVSETGESGTALPREEAIKTLEALLIELEKRKPKPARELLAKLGTHAWNSSARLLLTEMNEMLGKYRFVEVQSRAAELQRMLTVDPGERHHE